MSRSEPTFFVIVSEEGSPQVKLDLTNEILEMEYREEEDKTDTLVLKVRNWDLSNFDNPVWKPGNEVTVAWGYAGDMGPQRTCVISKVGGSTELDVEAQGAETRLNRVTKTRRFENRTRAEVVRAILVENGFNVDQLDIDDTAVRLETITQGRMTDYQFIRRLAEIEGFQLFADVDGMHFVDRRMGQRPIVPPLVWHPAGDGLSGSDASRGDILEFNIETDIFFSPKDKAGKVTIRGRDPLTKKDITVVASESSTTRDKTAPLALVVDQGASDQTGNSGVAQSTQVTEDTAPTSAQSAAAAKREADGRYRRQQNGTVELSVTTVGNPGLVAKTVVEVANIGQRYSGLYYIKSTSHRLGAGYTTELLLTSDGVSAALRVGGEAPDNAAAASSAAKLNTNKGGVSDLNRLVEKVAADGSVTYQRLSKGGAAELKRRGS